MRGNYMAKKEKPTRIVKPFRYRLIAFDHPQDEHSLAYTKKQGIVNLHEDIMNALEKGANLFSIRIFFEKGV